MPDLTMRTYRVCFESPLNTGMGDTITVVERSIGAAYFQEGGISGIGSDEDSKRFVVFKDTDHKPVFTVRATSVLTVEEIRE